MNAFFESILNGIFSIVHNYGWTIVVFTVLVRLVLMPLDYRSRKGMRKMSALSAQQAVLQKKYANDKDKLNRKLSELYKKEGVSPLSGCVPILIQWPILIIMFGAMRSMTNNQTLMQVFQYLAHPETTPTLDSWLWIKNIWQPDSLFAPIIPSANTLNIIPWDVWKSVFEKLSEVDQAAVIKAVTDLGKVVDFTTEAAGKATVTNLMEALAQLPAYTTAMQPISSTWNNVNVFLFSFTVYKDYNGLLILPALAALTQVAMNKLNPAQTGQTMDAGKDSAQAAAQASTGKMMQIFFPLLSVWFCLSSNAGFAIYWVTSNIAMGVMTIVMNKFLDKQDAEGKNKKIQATTGGSVR